MYAVRYCSKTGNTEKVAELIAEKLGVTAQSIDTPLSADEDKLFLGGAVHMITIDKSLKKFANGLNPAQVQKVFMFGTASSKMSIEKGLTDALNEAGVTISSSELFLHGLKPKKANITEDQKQEIEAFVDSATK